MAICAEFKELAFGADSLKWAKVKKRDKNTIAQTSKAANAFS